MAACPTCPIDPSEKRCDRCKLLDPRIKKIYKNAAAKAEAERTEARTAIRSEVPTDRKDDGVLRTGKHKGHTYQEVLRSDPKYCEWVATYWLRCNLDVIAFAGWLVPHYPFHNSLKLAKVGPSSIALSGKCKGLSYQEIKDTDPDYCTWIRKHHATVQEPSLILLGKWIRQ